MSKRKGTKRRRVTHCPGCGQGLSIDASHINWGDVWLRRALDERRERLGRPPTDAETVEVCEATGSDPCDDCCCGACGSRKYPGDVCC